MSNENYNLERKYFKYAECLYCYTIGYVRFDRDWNDLDIPVTIFVAIANINTDEEFRWDELERHLLDTESLQME